MINIVETRKENLLDVFLELTIFPKNAFYFWDFDKIFNETTNYGANKRTPSPKKLGIPKNMWKLNTALTSKLEADAFSAEENINKLQAVS